jgi:hypothetical protein
MFDDENIMPSGLNPFSVMLPPQAEKLFRKNLLKPVNGVTTKRQFSSLMQASSSWRIRFLLRITLHEAFGILSMMLSRKVAGHWMPR